MLHTELPGTQLQWPVAWMDNNVLIYSSQSMFLCPVHAGYKQHSLQRGHDVSTLSVPLSRCLYHCPDVRSGVYPIPPSASRAGRKPFTVAVQASPKLCQHGPARLRASPFLCKENGIVRTAHKTIVGLLRVMTLDL